MDGEILLYGASIHKAIQLNESAVAIWRLCDGTRTVKDIVDCLLAEYPHAQSSLLFEVQEAIELLLREGALIEQREHES